MGLMYLLDANVFIQAKNLHYGFDICPGFWDWLIGANRANKVYSIEQVKDEITVGDDELSDWVSGLSKNFFIQLNGNVIKKFNLIDRWINTQSYQAGAVTQFKQKADYYLIAHALERQAIIVTHEIPQDTEKKIKIPNVCIGLKIKWIHPFTMLKQEKARFTLGTDHAF